MSKEVKYIGPERRLGNDLSQQRAAQVINALEAAKDQLQSNKGSIRARFWKWLMDAIGTGSTDVNVDCKFRESYFAAKIRKLFIDSSKLSEIIAVSGLESRDAVEGLETKFLEARAGVLADLAEVLLRSGIVSEPREVRENEEIVFTEGHVYKMKVLRKNVVAFCIGFTGCGEYFSEGRQLPSGMPIFQFNYDGLNKTSFWSHHVIGRKYCRYEAGYDIYEEFCGYTRDGQSVMKFLERKFLGGAGEEIQSGMSS